MLVKGGNKVEGFLDGSGFAAVGVNKGAAAVYPALGVDNACIGFGIARVGAVAVTDQGAFEVLADDLFNVLATSAEGEGKDHLILTTV